MGGIGANDPEAVIPVAPASVDFEHARGGLGHETNRNFGGRVRYCRGDRNSYCATFEAAKWPYKNRAAENWTSSKLDLWATHEFNLWSSYGRPSELAGLLDRSKILGRPRFVG